MENVHQTVKELLKLLEQQNNPQHSHILKDSAPEVRSISPDMEEIIERLEIITHKLKFIAAESRPKVHYIQDINPIRTKKDPYIDQLILLAGGIPQTDPTVERFNPNVLLVFSDKPITELFRELPLVLSMSELSEIEAIKNDRVYIIHHSDYFKTNGSLVAEDAEILAEILFPGYFVFGRDEDTWMQFSLS